MNPFSFLGQAVAAAAKALQSFTVSAVQAAGRVAQAARPALAAGLQVAGRQLLSGSTLGLSAQRGLQAAGVSLGPAGIAATVLATAAVRAAESLNKMADEQLRFNRELAKSSAQMALVQAEGNVRTLLREREIGDRLSRSGRHLMQSEQRYQDNTKELTVLWNHIKNEVATGWNDFASGFMRVLNEIAKKLNIELGIDKAAGNLTFGEWMQQVRQQDHARAQGKLGPRWWDPPGNDRGRVGGGGRGGHGGDFGG